jgi:fatty-acyl-CoA synthase
MGFVDRVKGDIVFYRGAFRSLRRTAPIVRQPTRTFPFVIDELAQYFGDAPALLSTRETFSYRVLAERINKYARWALAQDIAKGDVVCLLMPNRPEYLAVWLGVTKVGGIAALLNTSLAGQSLAHCIDIVAPKYVIVAAELAGAWENAQSRLAVRPAVWFHGAGTGASRRLDKEIETYSGGALTDSERRALTIEDRALYIYTSGTTGMPKPANVNHHRIMLGCYGFAGVMNVKRSDRMYVCLPMYHSAGGLCAIGPLLVAGGSVAIRDKFSVREFWSDIVRYDCTLFQYIGELCRYLVRAPHDPNERRHRLRLACGNGLRPDIWTEFQSRSRVARIVEFYAATEGNVMLFNFEGKLGAVGRLPPMLARRYPVKLIAVDRATGAPLRDAGGFCIACGEHEIGEAIGRIAHHPSQPGSRFDGYASTADGERKILRDVFARGDAWFRTGDLMHQDMRGHFYFDDRIGDTFRWKGENVSTSEVEDAIGCFPGAAHANVYGVAVAGFDGRAGMAALVCGSGFDLAAFRAHLVDRLPNHARPLFLRLCSLIEVTTTFKQRKNDLILQGFDPSATGDMIYFNDRERGAFVRLDATLHRRIVSGEMRL